MAILGHQSPAMSLIYSRLSDPEVRRQYEDALSNGARIAGPAAESLLTGKLDTEAVHWLQTNFFKTELELGHCLRLPAEGPCECDLVLTCPKFLTTSEYAPRIWARLHIEDELIDDAERRGWTRRSNYTEAPNVVSSSCSPTSTRLPVSCPPRATGNVPLMTSR